MFHSEYLKDKVRYEKAITGFGSYFKSSFTLANSFFLLPSPFKGGSYVFLCLQCPSAEIILAASNCEVSEDPCENLLDEIKKMEEGVLKEINEDIVSLRFVSFEISLGFVGRDLHAV